MTLDISDAMPNDIPDLNRMIKALCAFHGDPCPHGLAETQGVLIGGSHIALVARCSRGAGRSRARAKGAVSLIIGTAPDNPGGAFTVPLQIVNL